MLVLSRTPQQKIQIGDNITVTVLRIKGNQIKLGIEAPRDVRVVRAELPPLVTGEEASANEANDVHHSAVSISQNEPSVGLSNRRPLRAAAPRTVDFERTSSFGATCSPRHASVPRAPGTAPLWGRVLARS